MPPGQSAFNRRGTEMTVTRSRIRNRLSLWLFRVCLPIMFECLRQRPRAHAPVITISGKMVIDTKSHQLRVPIQVIRRPVHQCVSHCEDCFELERS